MRGARLLRACVFATCWGLPNASALELRSSGPLVVTRDNQIIENLRIEAVDTPGITVRDFSNVTVRNVEIRHGAAAGIACSKASGLVIEQVTVTSNQPRRGGTNPNNIECLYSPRVKISHVRLTGGASGIYLLESPYAALSNVEGHDFVGGFPRGQLVQFDKSDHCLLSDFSVENDPTTSWTEDNVSVFKSNHCVVRNGLVDGNNSPSGVGVMFENSTDGLIEDVDVIRQSNGSFSAYPGERVTFRRTRTTDNICGDLGRGFPLSGALLWAGSPESKGLRIESAIYMRACNPRNIVWEKKSFDLVEVREAEFTPRAPLALQFQWQAR